METENIPRLVAEYLLLITLTGYLKPVNGLIMIMKIIAYTVQFPVKMDKNQVKPYSTLVEWGFFFIG